ncbi:MAG TPA: DUF371 domain-containing protein [Nitrososphaerales archaeon]|nr:DUF371 domain-containing protein [Nitrososphaerales archaeon]
MASDERIAARVVVDRIAFRGHPMVMGIHPTTIELTTENHLTERGDCIIGVGADKGCLDLSDDVKRALRSDGAEVTISIKVGEERLDLRCWGDSRLTLTNPREVVIRKSSYVDNRTLAIGADCAAIDIPRSLVERLKRATSTGVLEIAVLPP